MMNLVMSGLAFEICLVYLDDIIVFAADLDTHLKRIAQVLDRLNKAGLKLKPSKCCFLQQEVSFLGHRVSGNGIETDPEKIRVVEEWPTPASLREVRSFVGLCAYYRRFVPDFAEIARPLHALTKKGVRFQWTAECESAFIELKRRLTATPILALPNDSDLYILDTDASLDAIGAVLSQVQQGQERVIAYGSRVCTPAEKNYDVTRRELLAVVHFLKFFRQYLLGRQFLLRTDHSALQWLRKTPQPIGQHARWLTIIEEFNFDVQHRPGTAHRNADALSRRPILVEVIRERKNAVTTTAADSHDWSSDCLRREQEADPDLKWILKWKNESAEPPSADLLRGHSPTIKTLVAQWPQLEEKGGLLMRKWLHPRTGELQWHQLIPPPGRRDAIICQAHGGMSGGHLGMRKTMAQVSKRAYWPGWREDVRICLRRCQVCARYLRGHPPRQGKLQSMNVGAPLECIGIDITGPHPVSSTGYRYILTIVDHFTRWAEAYPIRNQNATTVANVLVKEFVSRFGCPRQILSDQGPCFEAILFQDLCRLLGVDKLRTSPYKPSTNGAVERFHRTLNSMLAKVVSQNQKDWDRHLPFVLAAYRASESESTGFTPNRLFLSRELCLPIDLVLGDCRVLPDCLSVDAFIVEQLSKIQTDFAYAREFMQRQATVRACRYDLRVRETSFRPGDFVWYFYPRRRSGLKDKWSKTYIGPYQVLDKLSPVLYRIRKTPKSQPLIVYVDKLKKVEGELPSDKDALDVTLDPNPEDILEDAQSSEMLPERPKRMSRKPARFCDSD
jgi:transposase InsO family protein